MIEAFRHDAGAVYHIVKRCLIECPAFVNGSAEHTRCCSKEACNDVISIGIPQSPHVDVAEFLADRTNGRAIATLLRLSSVVVVCRRLSVCDVMYCG